MGKFAVIKTGGKQYKVSVGDILDVEKLKLKEGDKKYVFEEILLVSDDKDVKVGDPILKGVKVEAQIIEPELKDKKIQTTKYKPKKRYKRTVGHRQRYTKIKITKI
jgi:large subunit ribosomal protein L21